MASYLSLALAALFALGFAQGYFEQQNFLLLSCDPSARKTIARESMDRFVQGHHESAYRELAGLEICPQPLAREEALKAHMLYRLGDFRRAEFHGRNAIRLDPYTADAFGLIGQIHYRERKLTKALRFLNRSLELDPEGREFEKTRFAVLYELGLAPLAPMPIGRGPASKPQDH